MAARVKRPSIRRLLLPQLAAIGLMMGLAAWLDGGSGAFSALAGGAVAFLPNAFFAWRVFGYRGARHAKNIANGFYRAEAGKFGLTVALFTLVFVAVPPSNHALFFGAYMVMLFVHWLAAWLGTRLSPN
ncbi:F0F1 ATP synthase assembly protein I [Halomonas eurihalina]|uniref:F0F1 ATP synthase assembly protein I n=1 Tax=Halomonas eurihalina TaxID=42566 RepID=A0A5D9CVL8_HALER|nr:ATP synthase subunit I [Halomonas eurihalina]MDR5860119.1 ATP synthase subunit I [Halomonas eurihalina]TZG35122.1 F0F1 ATP synthase assembly protein I [Halomonas eurihalina]